MGIYRLWHSLYRLSQQASLLQWTLHVQRIVGQEPRKQCYTEVQPARQQVCICPMQILYASLDCWMLHIKPRDQSEDHAVSTSLGLTCGYCRGSVHQLAPTTQGNVTDDGAPLPAVILLEGIDHPISASPLGHYYRYDTHAYAYERKPCRSA